MDNKELFDAGDEVSVSKRKTKVQLKKEKEIEALRQVLSTRAGLDVVWKILEFCNIYDPSFTGNSQTFFNEGKRYIGLEILRYLDQVDPRAYALMKLNRLDEEKE